MNYVDLKEITRYLKGNTDWFFVTNIDSKTPVFVSPIPELSEKNMQAILSCYLNTLNRNQN